MALSSDLISQFVKVTQDKQETNKESTAYGKIIKQGDVEYVQLDGSDLLTPISSTTVVKDGDRVMVTIKNHTAIVTGDFTNPSANKKDVIEIGNKITNFEIIIADKVSTKQLEAEIARIEELRVKELEATNAKIETMEVKVAKIDKLETDMIDVSGKVTAHEGEFTTLRADIADFKNVTSESVKAVEGKFNTLEADYTSFEQTTTNKLTAYEADIKDLETNMLTSEKADLKYANIDFSNIKEAAIEKLFTDSGIIENLIMSEGKVTGKLVGVTISGDLIEGNTVKADKLVVLGEDGLYYKLNVNSLGEATASSDKKYQNGLDGSVIIANSITAEHIAVDDLVAFGATIGGFHITDHTLYSGVKESIDNNTEGVFLSDDGQINIGDTNNYLKYYIDENGEYKLEILAQNIKFKTDGQTIEEIIDNTNIELNKISELELGMDGINASVVEIKNEQTSTKDTLDAMDKDITELTNTVSAKMSSTEVQIAIQNELANGVSHVKTSTGFTLNEDGLTISKTGKEMTTTIDEDGMTIKRNEEERLIADNEGVIAYDLQAKTYLIIGENSRFEDYEEDRKPQTGCFWIGETNIAEVISEEV